ncbi:MAG: carbohydrate porin [Pseudomonadota bacterium]
MTYGMSSCLRALPLVAALVSFPALAEPSAADIAQMLQAMQARLDRLEARNAELENRLAEKSAGAGEAVLSARVEELEQEVVALSKKPDPMERFEGISVGASLTTVVQHANHGAVDDGQWTSRADVEVELPMGSIGEAEGRLFAHFRAGDGGGVDTGGFVPVNAAAFGDESRMDLMQAWYQLDIPVGTQNGDLGRVELTVGKIDPFGFFDGNNIADDESEQFLNLAFIHNPLLDAGGDIGVGDDGASPGVRVSYISDVNGSNNYSASLGYFGAGEGGDFSDAFSNRLLIGQLEYAGKTFGGMAGAYRLYAWTNNSALKLDEVTEERHSGWGISLDQQIAEHVTLFSRLGFSTKGEVGFDRAYTLGAQFDGGLWGRADDRIGLAVGRLEATKASGMSGNETPVELYYAWQVNDHLLLSPNLHWIGEPGGDESADDITVLGVRAKLSY